MKAGNCQWLFSHVETRDGCSSGGHCFGQNATTAANIENLATVKVCVFANPVEPQWIDFVQGSKFSVGIPPARRKGVELGDFRCVDVLPDCCHSSWLRYFGDWLLLIRCCHSLLFSRRVSVSIFFKLPFSS